MLDARAARVLATSNALNLRYEPAVVLDVRVPALERRVEIGDLVTALREPHRLRRVRQDAVLVPGDVPCDGDDELAAHARERDDRRARLAEALRDAADRAPVVARVEDVRRLHHLQLGL